MNIEIFARKCEANEHLKRVIEQKLSKLDKYFSDSQTKAKVNLKKEANSFTTEIMLDYAGKLVRATASGENFYDNLDVVMPKLEGQIRKYRTRFDKHNKNTAYSSSSLFEGEKEYEDKKANLVKEKKFVISPMTVNEAIEEMDILGHNFYVFLDAKTQTVQVIYRRNDGDVGLIEPIIE